MIELLSSIGDADGVRNATLAILRGVRLCSIGTVGKDTRSHVNTAFFCFDESLILYFLSDPSSHHARNIEENPWISVAICDTDQTWGDDLCGLQMAGECHLMEPDQVPDIDALYGERFPRYRDYVDSLAGTKPPFKSSFYAFRPDEVVLFDERQFGEEVLVMITVVRG